MPTLTMMRGVAALGDGSVFEAACRDVAALHRAGVPILAGADANVLPGVPVHLPHGPSLHEGLELPVGASLSSTCVLRAATELPARHFGLTGRGSIQLGPIVELLLIEGDPTAEIRATRNILSVWCVGVRHAPC
ncbi:hypothetical protein ACFC1T_17740 [Kitasatospora sp. NPDC056076]|uniref:hypothetical protein n=1 Tax=Kitasatospora sp. NPDC056076 TaxID=3345703 RepID=UPI0035DBACAC